MKKNQVEYKPKKIKPTFDMLLNKYVRQAGSKVNQQHGKGLGHRPSREATRIRSRLGSSSVKRLGKLCKADLCILVVSHIG